MVLFLFVVSTTSTDAQLVDLALYVCFPSRDWHRAGHTRNCTHLTEESVGQLPYHERRGYGHNGDDDDNEDALKFLPVFVDDWSCKFFHKDRPLITLRQYPPSQPFSKHVCNVF